MSDEFEWLSFGAYKVPIASEFSPTQFLVNNAYWLTTQATPLKSLPCTVMLGEIHRPSAMAVRYFEQFNITDSVTDKKIEGKYSIAILEKELYKRDFLPENFSKSVGRLWYELFHSIRHYIQRVKLSPADKIFWQHLDKVPDPDGEIAKAISENAKFLVEGCCGEISLAIDAHVVAVASLNRLFTAAQEKAPIEGDLIKYLTCTASEFMRKEYWMDLLV